MNKPNTILSTILLSILFLVLCDASYAVTLHGKVYDLELNELNNVVVTVDSTPQQRYVSKEGGYSFELNPGEYEITATYSLDGVYKYTSTDNVSISEEGDYVYDLFLLPDIEVDEDGIISELDVADLGTPEESKSNTGATIAIVVIVVILLLLAYFIIIRQKKRQNQPGIKNAGQTKQKTESAEHNKQKHSSAPAEPEDEDIEKLVVIIRKEGGRTTQKEIRKQMPLSEAKISLMITELEHKGIVEKIKKGRGNIIVLKK